MGEFRIAAGFGYLRTRSLPLERRYVEIPPLESIPFPDAPLTPSAESPADAPLATGPLAPPPAATIDEWNARSVAEFVNPAGFGLITGQDEVEVYGFQSHGFLRQPELTSGDASATVRWQLSDLSLVSLLKHAEPVAYL